MLLENEAVVKREKAETLFFGAVCFGEVQPRMCGV